MNVKRFALGLCAGMMVWAMAALPANAHQLDAYRNLMAAENYTIEYENITPKQGDAVTSNYTCTVTSQGDKRAWLRDAGQKKAMQLILQDQTYKLQYKKNKWRSSAGRRQAAPVLRCTAAHEAIYGMQLAPQSDNELIGLLLPAGKKPFGMADYAFVSAGQLSGGLSYEDYRQANDQGMHAARFYFRDGKLVKMTLVAYAKKADGQLTGYDTILKINRFDGIARADLLQAPGGVTLQD